MNQFGFLTGILVLAVTASSAQTCPKVTYTTPTPTLKSLVAAVNCLAANSEQAGTSKPSAPAKSGMQVETFQIVGPQHSRPYSGIVMAVLTVPTGGAIKSAVVTPDNREANVSTEAGGSCSVKINADKTVDSHCYIAGGTVYVVYR
jgi:hypothetical protein